MTRWAVLVLAAVGLVLGVWTVLTSGRQEVEPPPASPPSVNPFTAGIAATGLVEAASRDIVVAAPEPGLVTAVHVQVNDTVAKDQPLFQLDPRPLEADRIQARAAAQVAQARLEQLLAAPRPEEVPIAQAQVEAAQAEAAYTRSQYELTQQVYQQNAATREELDRARYQWEAAQGRLAEAQARLNELNAGTWQRQIEVARAELAQAQAQLQAIETRLARLTVRSPIAGVVLKRNVDPGEYTAPGVGQEPAMILGDLSAIHVRAQVDEEDAPRLREGAEAVARVRGPVDVRLPLEMIRIEPYAQPKRQLTGASTELVDTRVVEVLFRVQDDQGVPLYPGQLVDVFIEGAPAAAEGTAATQPVGSRP
ncbi:MAG TPA: HlyD family efflux transporter periplasmic adaptor subunit [Phycisphaeraceae bacterium]